MDDFEELARRRLAELEQQRAAFIKSAQTNLDQLNGAIAILRELLELDEDEQAETGKNPRE